MLGRLIMRTFFAALTLVGVSGSALAQCQYEMDLVSAFEAIGQPLIGASQDPANGWLFMRGDWAPTSSSFLTGITLGGFGAWGDPTQPFSVPLVGLIYSPDPLRDQNPYRYRLPSFEGLMCHPGYGSLASEVWVRPQSAVSLTQVRVQCEHLGQASPDAVVAADIIDSSGSATSLFNAVIFLSLAAATELNNSVAVLPLPTTIGAGAALRVRFTNGGSPFEDWVNGSITVTVQGPPTILGQPRDLIISGPTTGTFRISAAGAASYRWHRHGEPLDDGPTATGATLSGTRTADLTITHPSADDAGDGYTCVVSNGCGSVTSEAVMLSVCPPDFDADGFITFTDTCKYS